MSVHNSEHNTPFNSDHDDDINDSVIRISKLDIKGKNKFGFIDGSCKRSNTDEVLGKQWDRYDAMIELPKCVCNASEGFKKHNQLLKLMQFLMGLDDSYMQIRSSILSRETLSDVRSAYATIFSEESHRVAVGSIAGSYQRNQASAFVQGGGSGLNNNRPSGGSGVVCENCSFNGHTIDKCFKIIGYPGDFGKKKSGQNVKKQVGHPNGTEAYISKIENLRLSNGLTLYDDLNLKNVLGIGEQCGGLYYYSDKGIKSNTSTLNFQCMLSQHDWHYRLGHPEDPVLNVLKDSLNFDKKDNTSCYEICQRAKQTREPFPLSDHKSKNLGDLVHLDLWGPYKVTSSEGFRFFLTVVDDYTRAVWVYLIKSKDEVSHIITIFYNLIENQFKRKIKVFRNDNGTEFANHSVSKLCSDKGIIHQTSCVYTPQQNRIAERKHRHLLNVARSFKLPYFVLNRKSPYEMIYKKCPRYRLYSLDKHQFIFSRDVKFFENIFPVKDSEVRENDFTNVLQDVNHINFFDIEYPEIPNDDERVANDLNKGKSDSSSSSESGNNINTADFPVDSGNDADSSSDFVVTQDEDVATLEENIFSDVNL
ncbi:ribonuclease H-like domain-containing protein, partial [Tanacetum coccineum]